MCISTQQSMVIITCVPAHTACLTGKLTLVPLVVNNDLGCSICVIVQQNAINKVSSELFFSLLGSNKPSKETCKASWHNVRKSIKSTLLPIHLNACVFLSIHMHNNSHIGI